MADIAPEARLIDVHGLETINVLGPTIQFITPATDDRAPCVMRGTVPPGIVIPLHSHADPETFIAVSGALEGLVFSGDDFRWVSIGPGNVLHVPGHAKHAFRNTGAEPAVHFVISTARMGRFFREIGTPVPPGSGSHEPPTPEAIKRFLAVAVRYGYWNASPEENARVGLSLPAFHSHPGSP